ncbi:hypothetical protein ACNHKD_04305 [Methylocystis sp. JAN1]|uniref:hypothetical protein n=1 Tax=Methylocystis sp. JAN1 TaxID=3397211 RepID=UPI003FA307DC
MRTLIEDALESLLLLLDEIDGDPDIEEEQDREDGADDEPSLGAPGTFMVPDQTPRLREKRATICRSFPRRLRQQTRTSRISARGRMAGRAV